MSSTGPILVIGGTRGTGLLIAERLARRGDAVRVLARRPDRAATRLPAGVQIVRGDLTRPETLPHAVAGASAIVFTAGSRSGIPERESRVRATDHEGVRSVIAAAQRTGFAGRLLYMNSIGVTTRSLPATLLNLYKGNVLRWRRRAEDEIRASALDYTIMRAGFLLNRAGGSHELMVTQEALPLSLRYRIARADVADVFVAALDSSLVSRATFDVVWSKGPATSSIPELLRGITADVPPGVTRRAETLASERR
jgi:uncharacterized protein YbjT (DUF2867 family)